MESTIAAETKNILTIAEDSPMGIALLTVLEMAKAANNDKGHYSVEYFAEDMLTRGVSSFRNYLDADKTRRALKRFNDAIAKLKVPAPGNVQAMQAYGSQIAKLQAEFGIGGQEQEL